VCVCVYAWMCVSTCIHAQICSLSLPRSFEVLIRLQSVCTHCLARAHAPACTKKQARPRTHAPTNAHLSLSSSARTALAHLRARIYAHIYTHTHSRHLLTLTQTTAEDTRKNEEATTSAEAVAAAAMREEKERVAAVAKKEKKARAAAAVSVFCSIHRNCSNKQSISSVKSYYHSAYLKRLTNLLTTLTTLVASLLAIVDEEMCLSSKEHYN